MFNSSNLFLNRGNIVNIDHNNGVVTIGLERAKKKTNKKRKSVPKALKDKLWDTEFGPEAGQAECYCCNGTINSKRFEAGHIVAVANGGRTILSNLHCVCGTCNKSMGTQNMEEFKQEFFPELMKKMEDLNLDDEDDEDVIEPCCLCFGEVMNELIHNKKYFDCFKTVSHYQCWKEYLELATNRYGRRETFLRNVDCPICLDKKWQLLEN
jgi:hypothetical protein